MVRKAAVAGQFYHGDAVTLSRDLDKLIPDIDEKIEAIGAVVPHAGYMYSGGVAGEVFARLAARSTFVILSPNHTGAGKRFALSQDPWATPLGIIEIDTELAEAILSNSELVQSDREAHAFEHSIEVQLPFIQKLFSGTRIVPITVSHGSEMELAEIAGAVYKAASSVGRDITVIASSDMTHYENRKIAGEKDGAAIERILDMDAEGLLDVVSKKHISMCGSVPAAIMLMYADLAGAKEGKLVKYTDSGAVTGDTDEVVGYAGIIII